MEHFASVLRPRGQRPGADLTLTSPGEAEKARRFHSGLPGYAPTPLVSLDGLAHSLGVSKIWIKDESKRVRPQRLQGAGRELCHGPVSVGKAGEALGGDEL